MRRCITHDELIRERQEAYMRLKGFGRELVQLVGFQDDIYILGFRAASKQPDMIGDEPNPPDLIFITRWGRFCNAVLKFLGY